MTKILKVAAAGIALVLFGFVLVAWMKNNKPLNRDANMSLGASLESRPSNYGVVEGAGAEVPQTVLPELARLENVTWSQDLQGKRVVNFQFISLNPVDPTLGVYQSFLQNGGWRVSVFGNTVLGVQEGKQISYTFTQIDNGVLVTGKYEEASK